MKLPTHLLVTNMQKNAGTAGTAGTRRQTLAKTRPHFGNVVGDSGDSGDSGQVEGDLSPLSPVPKLEWGRTLASVLADVPNVPAVPPKNHMEVYAWG